MLDVLTPEQAAEALGCEPQHINELAASRKLPAVKYGRSWRFPISALNEHLARKAMEHIEFVPAPPASPLTTPVKRERKRSLPDLSKYS